VCQYAIMHKVWYASVLPFVITHVGFIYGIGKGLGLVIYDRFSFVQASLINNAQAQEFSFITYTRQSMAWLYLVG
jgi:hypothetical protein